MGIHFGNGTAELTGYVDADWASSVDDRRSYTGYAFALAGGPVSWESKKQRTIALSSTEAEYMALSEACREAIHLRKLITDLNVKPQSVIENFNDNLGAKKLAENPIFHSRTKHIQVRHHFVREAIKVGDVKLSYMPTDKMPADVLTKVLAKIKHWRCLHSLGVSEINPEFNTTVGHLGPV